MRASSGSVGSRQSATTAQVQPPVPPAAVASVAGSEPLQNEPILSSGRRQRQRPLTASRLARAYGQLAKHKLSVFVTGTAALGFLTAGPPVSVPALLGVTLGTYLCSASAATLNQMYEVRNDAAMTRTRARPLPSGRLSLPHAGAFAAATGLAGVGVLTAACNPVTAALGALNIGLYAAVYTPLKQRTPLNTEIGAIVGAIPPLMGWAACTGSITADPAGLALFGAMFLWQMPHFYALAWRHRADYERGGYKMISRGDANGARTAGRTWAYSLALMAFPAITTATGVTGPMFLVELTAANLLFLRQASRFRQDPGDGSARGVFFASLWYLPVLMGCLAFHSHRWRRATDEEDARRLSVALPAVDSGADEAVVVEEREQEATTGAAARDDGSPRWLEEVDANLAFALADDPASRAVSRALSGAASRLRSALRVHCPHELLATTPAAADDASDNTTSGKGSDGASRGVDEAMRAAGRQACPVTHQTPRDVQVGKAVLDKQGEAAVKASTLACPVAAEHRQ